MMMALQGDAPVAAISAHLAAQGVNVLGFEELADEGATITEIGDAPAVVEHVRSALRAVWIVDVASRAAAVGSKCANPTVSRTLHPLRRASTPSSRICVGPIVLEAHAGRGVEGSVHATFSSAVMPPKRSMPGPSERSSLTRSPRSEYCASWPSAAASKESPRNCRGTGGPGANGSIVTVSGGVDWASA